MTITAYDDLNTRWHPSAEAEQKARDLLVAKPCADMAIVPLVQSGKVHGIWDTGQEVVTVDRVFLAVKRDGSVTEPGVSYYGVARNLAADTAAKVLERDYAGNGTVAYALVYRDDAFMPVFED